MAHVIGNYLSVARLRILRCLWALFPDDPSSNYNIALIVQSACRASHRRHKRAIWNILVIP